jgi:hypothetical protein
MSTNHKPHNKASLAVNGYFLSKNDNAVMRFVVDARRVKHKTVIYSVIFSQNMNNYS